MPALGCGSGGSAGLRAERRGAARRPRRESRETRAVRDGPTRRRDREEREREGGRESGAPAVPEPCRALRHGPCRADRARRGPASTRIGPATRSGATESEAAPSLRRSGPPPPPVGSRQTRQPVSSRWRAVRPARTPGPDGPRTATEGETPKHPGPAQVGRRRLAQRRTRATAEAGDGGPRAGPPRAERTDRPTRPPQPHPREAAAGSTGSAGLRRRETEGSPAGEGEARTPPPGERERDGRRGGAGESGGPPRRSEREGEGQARPPRRAARKPGRPRPAAPAREGYLVDPASSHMLVSKIKPCMSK